MTAGDSTDQRHYRLRLGVGFSVLLLLMTWLFWQSGKVSSNQHNAYLQSLRHIHQADIELNAAVLASYSDLLRNYDPMVQKSEAIDHELTLLLVVPGWLQNDSRTQLAVLVEQLQAAHRKKVEAIGRFMRSNAVLRNSERYFPLASDALLRQPGLARLPEVERFIRQVLLLSHGANRQQLDVLRESRRRLAQLPVSADAEGALKQVLLHADAIIEQRPVVQDLLEEVMRSPTAAMHEDVTGAYAAGYGETLRIAGDYRKLLYVVSLILAALVVYALLRNERDRRALAVAHQDLAERYEAQHRVEGQLQLYATVFTNASEGMAITDCEARIVAVNPAFCAITGYDKKDILGHNPAILGSGRQGADFYRQMWTELREQGVWQGEIWNRRKDGAIYPEWLSIAAVTDETGTVTNYIGVFTDISERKQSEARIQHLAHHDALTGLPNRLLLDDRIGQAMRKSNRSKRPMALVFVDLDRFKNINDTLGHEVGDTLLVQAAQRGLSVLRETDTLARQGGDEFVVILPELEQAQDAMHATRKLLHSLCQPYLLAGHELTVSGSAGIAIYPDDGVTTSELLRKADAAMYRAKEEGRNTFRFYSAETNTASLDELLLENDLYSALEHNELSMHYQPKVDAISGEIVGAEALMRWTHPEHGLISPTRFIPLAEANGLINGFGEWAIKTVCAQQRAWLDGGLLAVPVAVNISAQQFAQQDLPRMVSHVLAAYGLPPQLLELELTESLLMRNASRARDVLQILRQMHVEVSIDDFGTGYSSLSYLKQFQVGALKIDRSFICEIDERGEKVKLASAIIAMAHELELKVIAEGVESRVQADYLLAHGCDQFQGYFYGRPQPAESFGQLLLGRQLDDPPA